MSAQTYIKSGKQEFDELTPRVERFLSKDTMDMVIDGEPIHEAIARPTRPLSGCGTTPT